MARQRLRHRTVHARGRHCRLSSIPASRLCVSCRTLRSGASSGRSQRRGRCLLGVEAHAGPLDSGFVERDVFHDAPRPRRRRQTREQVERLPSDNARFTQSDATRSTGCDPVDESGLTQKPSCGQAQPTGASWSIRCQRRHGTVESRVDDDHRKARTCLSNTFDLSHLTLQVD